MNDDRARPEPEKPPMTDPEPGRGAGADLAGAARPTGIYLSFTLVVGLLGELLLESARTDWNWAYVLHLVGRESGVLLLGAVVLALGAGLVLAVSGRMWVSGVVVLGLAAVVGLASNLKYVAQREPLYPRDLVFALQPDFLIEMVEPRVLWQAGLGLALLAAVSWGLSRLFSMWLHRARPQGLRRRTAVVGRAGAAAACLLLLSSLAQFQQPGNPWRGAYEAFGADWAKASQPNNYRANGFLGGFLYNLDTPGMRRPPGYSHEAMQRIVARYTAAAEAWNSQARGSVEDVNVVMVLSESLSDPTRWAGMSLAEDPLPRTRALMQRAPHGLMLSQKIGGGTSSMEFEALTGMSLAQFDPAMDTPYQMLVPRFRTFPSAVRTFERLGHATTAIHPYEPTMYQRDRVYPILGFDDFVARDDMTYRGHLEDGRFISDHAAFRQTLDTLEDHDEPVFVNLVTMQNHTPYSGSYSQPVPVTGLGPQGTDMVGQYAEGLSRTDLAISRFVKTLSRSDEKTVLLLYGDHLPAGLPDEVIEANSDRVLHETPFFVYANFQDLPPEELPTTSPIFFMPRLLRMLDAPLTPYYALLSELEQHVTAMEHGRMLGPEGEELSPGQLTPDARRVLRDYRLVQYDLSVGKRYAEAMTVPSQEQALAASGTGK